MGFYLDWVSVKGLGRDEVLARLGLRPTDVIVEWPRRGKAMVAETASGRVVVVINDYGRLTHNALRHLSKDASLVAGRAESNYCTSRVWGLHDDRELWSVEWSGEGLDEEDERTMNDQDGLIVTGRPPAQLGPIRKRLLAEKRSEDDAEDPPLLFEAPLELAAAIGGWAPETIIGSDLKFFAAADSPKEARAALARWIIRLLVLAVGALALLVFIFSGSLLQFVGR